MGRDKALVPVDGVPMALRVARAATDAGAVGVVTVGGDRAALEALGLRAVPDADPGEGPLAGVLTALTWAAAERRAGHEAGDGVVLVVACDLVAPSAGAMAAVVRALAAEDGADVAAPVVDGRVQWAHAAWRERARGPLAHVFAVGERAVHGAVAAAGLTLARVGDVPADALADADTPADLPGA
jgi:molybdopterin-guanine dinucleotide biosynthesis protein A